MDRHGFQRSATPNSAHDEDTGFMRCGQAALHSAGTPDLGTVHPMAMGGDPRRFQGQVDSASSLPVHNRNHDSTDRRSPPPWPAGTTRIDEEACTSSAGSYSTELTSLWLSDDSENDDTPTLEEGHPYLQIKDILVHALLKKFREWHRSVPETSQPPTAPAQLPPPPQRSWSRGDSSKSRRRGGKESEDNREQDDESRGSASTSRKRPRREENKLTFACPFLKWKPIQHGHCCSYYLTSATRVKQHLLRVHRPPVYCPRCGTIFDGETAEAQRDSHARQEPSCEACKVEYDWITEAQERQLHKKSSPKLSDEQKWFAMFDILFPEHRPRPDCPYLNATLSHQAVQLQEYIFQQAPRLIPQMIEMSDGNPLDPLDRPNEERD